MPTLIGRFNELLHNLSSSSSSTNGITVRSHSSSSASSSSSSSSKRPRRPPTKSNSSNQHSTTNRNNNNNNNNNKGEQRSVVKRSQTTGSNKQARPISCANNIRSTSRGLVATKSSSFSDNSNRCDVDGGQQQQSSSSHPHHRNRQHRASSCGVSQCSQQHQLKHYYQQKQPHSCSSKRETNIHHYNSNNHNQKISSTNQRRHSISSMASVSNINCKKSNLQRNPSGNKQSYSNVTSNNGDKQPQQKMVGKITNAAALTANEAIENNNNNINNENDDTNLLSVMKKPVNNFTNKQQQQQNQLNVDESLASMLVRKMRLGAIARKGHGHTQIFHKKISKITKKDVETELDAKGTFINRYLDGQLIKQHPDIISGKTCYDMPIKDIEILATNVVAACTGPNDGLLIINTSSKPFELAIDDVDFIDEDYPDSSLSSNGCDLSPQNSAKLSTSTVSSDTGEPVTLSDLDTDHTKSSSKKSDYIEPVAGVQDWNRSSDFAYGISTTLYESLPNTKQKAGDPIADSYAICLRDNSAIIALADGVNWGQKACLASRCAVHGCIDYLNKALYSTAESTRSRNTMDIFVALLRSFNAAHNMILSQDGHLTTLCAAVICQLKDSDRFIVCTCNVGDSLAYVYSSSHGVREITQGSHDIFSMRDMRDALGALGPVSGSEPELNNLTVAMTIVDVGDIVFLTSDGISDNFDPVVGKFAIPKKEHKQQPPIDEEKMSMATTAAATDKKLMDTNENINYNQKQSKCRKLVQRSNSNPEKSSARHLNYTSKGLPLVSAQQRHELTLLRMEDLIMNGVNGDSLCNANRTGKKSAKELCQLMVDFSTKLTMAKRRILEDPDLYSEDEDSNDSEAFDRQRRRRRLVGPKLAQVPGKLDHASIAAIEVGFYGSLRVKKAYLYDKKAAGEPNSKHSLEARYNLKLKATLARFESQDSLESINEAGPI